ncbi:MAG: hypothetical protein ACKOBF_13095, partial [Limnohabitans sp.]
CASSRPAASRIQSLSFRVYTALWRVQQRILSAYFFGWLDQAKLNSKRPRMIASWCTDPTLKPLLNMVNVEYHYSDGAGRYIGKIEIGTTDCR